MRVRYIIAGAGLIALALAGIATPWEAPPRIAYETVTGYPMQLYYRNVGMSPADVSGFQGMVSLTTEEPMAEADVRQMFAALARSTRPLDAAVKAGEYLKLELDDPERLAWEPAKTDRPTYFYIMAVLKSPRLVVGEWVNELCLVAKTGEPFRRCPQHNRTYAAL